MLPQVPEPKIEGSKLERLTVEAGDEMVDAAVASIAEQQKSFDAAPADHAARPRRRGLIDFVGKVDGEAFEGGTGEGMSVEIGSGRLIPGFEEQLDGVKANEQRTLNVTFPAGLSGRLPQGPRRRPSTSPSPRCRRRRRRRPTTSSPSRSASRASSSCAAC